MNHHQLETRPQGAETVNPASEYDLVLTRVFAAPRELVWKATTEPDLADA